MRKIPFIKIIAKDNEEFGYRLGKILSGRIKKRIKVNKQVYREMGRQSINALIKDAKAFLPAIQAEYPQLLAEAKSICRGAGISFEEFLVLNCEEELLDFYIHHCTSLAVHMSNGETYIAHNDDWLPIYRENGLYIVEAHINNHSFLALSYMGSLPGTSCGLNNRGIAYTVNSLNYQKFRKGIPRNFLLRALLETKTLGEAEKLLTDPWRSICTNTLLAKNNRAEDVESLWHHYEIFHGNSWLVHTNHPLRKQNQSHSNTDPESVKRYERVVEILRKEPKPTINTLKKILKDHKAGICGHIEKRHAFYGVTIASAIIDPIEKWMDICYANPCVHRYHRYSLK